MDTSMGFTPLTGVMMGSRSGDVDPTILIFIGINDHWLDCLYHQLTLLTTLLQDLLVKLKDTKKLSSLWSNEFT